MLKHLKHSIALAIFALVLVSTSRSALAHGPYDQAYSWYGGGSYSNYSQEYVPYYALNPPVYYSYPVARTYGLYPFPYFSESTQCPAVAVDPKLVRNTFVEQQTVEKSEAISQQPLRITNPFVDQAGGSNPVKKVELGKAEFREAQGGLSK